MLKHFKIMLFVIIIINRLIMDISVRFFRVTLPELIKLFSRLWYSWLLGLFGLLAGQILTYVGDSLFYFLTNKSLLNFRELRQPLVALNYF
jgi:hypothetical protein